MGASEDSEWKVWLTDGDTIREVRIVVDDCPVSDTLTPRSLLP
jgi:hypothetical protein